MTPQQLERGKADLLLDLHESVQQLKQADTCLQGLSKRAMQAFSLPEQLRIGDDGGLRYYDEAVPSEREIVEAVRKRTALADRVAELRECLTKMGLTSLPGG